MKLCKDCKWYRVPSADYLDPNQFSRCVHPSQTSPVTGTVRVTFCDTQRSHESRYGFCGEEASLFEPGDGIPVLTEAA